MADKNTFGTNGSLFNETDEAAKLFYAKYLPEIIF